MYLPHSPRHTRPVNNKKFLLFEVVLLLRLRIAGATGNEGRREPQQHRDGQEYVDPDRDVVEFNGPLRIDEDGVIGLLPALDLADIVRMDDLQNDEDEEGGKHNRRRIVDQLDQTIVLLLAAITKNRRAHARKQKTNSLDHTENSAHHHRGLGRISWAVFRDVSFLCFFFE